MKSSPECLPIEEGMFPSDRQHYGEPASPADADPDSDTCWPSREKSTVRPPPQRRKSRTEPARTRPVRISIAIVPKESPFRFCPAIPVSSYQTWLRIAAASTEKTITPAIISAIVLVAFCLRPCFCELICLRPPAFQCPDYITLHVPWQILAENLFGKMLNKTPPRSGGAGKHRRINDVNRMLSC